MTERDTRPPGKAETHENATWRRAAERSNSPKMYQVDENNAGYYTPNPSHRPAPKDGKR